MEMQARVWLCWEELFGCVTSVQGSAVLVQVRSLLSPIPNLVVTQCQHRAGAVMAGGMRVGFCLLLKCAGGGNGVWDHSLLLREEVGEAVLALLVCGFALCAVLLVDGSHVADGLWASCALWLVPGGICHSWLLCWGPCSRSSAVVLEGRPCLLG